MDSKRTAVTLVAALSWTMLVLIQGISYSSLPVSLMCFSDCKTGKARDTGLMCQLSTSMKPGKTKLEGHRNWTLFGETLFLMALPLVQILLFLCYLISRLVELRPFSVGAITLLIVCACNFTTGVAVEYNQTLAIFMRIFASFGLISLYCGEVWTRLAQGEKEQYQLMKIFSIVLSLGTILGPIVAAPMCQTKKTNTWQYLFYILGVIQVICTLMFIVMDILQRSWNKRINYNPKKQASRHPDLLKLLRHQNTLGYIVSIGSHSAATSLISAMLPLYLHRFYDWSIIRSSIALCGFLLCRHVGACITWWTQKLLMKFTNMSRLCQRRLIQVLGGILASLFMVPAAVSSPDVVLGGQLMCMYISAIFLGAATGTFGQIPTEFHQRHHDAFLFIGYLSSGFFTSVAFLIVAGVSLDHPDDQWHATVGVACCFLFTEAVVTILLADTSGQDGSLVNYDTYRGNDVRQSMTILSNDENYCRIRLSYMAQDLSSYSPLIIPVNTGYYQALTINEPPPDYSAVASPSGQLSPPPLDESRLPKTTLALGNAHSTSSLGLGSGSLRWSLHRRASYHRSKSLNSSMISAEISRESAELKSNTLEQLKRGKAPLAAEELSLDRSRNFSDSDTASDSSRRKLKRRSKSEHDLSNSSIDKKAYIYAHNKYINPTDDTLTKQVICENEKKEINVTSSSKNIKLDSIQYNENGPENENKARTVKDFKPNSTEKSTFQLEGYRENVRNENKRNRNRTNTVNATKESNGPCIGERNRRTNFRKGSVDSNSDTASSYMDSSYTDASNHNTETKKRHADSQKRNNTMFQKRQTDSRSISIHSKRNEDVDFQLNPTKTPQRTMNSQNNSFQSDKSISSLKEIRQPLETQLDRHYINSNMNFVEDEYGYVNIPKDKTYMSFNDDILSPDVIAFNTKDMSRTQRNVKERRAQDISPTKSSASHEVLETDIDGIVQGELSDGSYLDYDVSDQTNNSLGNNQVPFARYQQNLSRYPYENSKPYQSYQINEAPVSYLAHSISSSDDDLQIERKQTQSKSVDNIFSISKPHYSNQFYRVRSEEFIPNLNSAPTQFVSNINQYTPIYEDAKHEKFNTMKQNESRRENTNRYGEQMESFGSFEKGVIQSGVNTSSVGTFPKFDVSEYDDDEPQYENLPPRGHVTRTIYTDLYGSEFDDHDFDQFDTTYDSGLPSINAMGSIPTSETYETIV